jgi:ribosomal protein L27
MELIQFNTQIITENNIDISNDSTCFARKERKAYPNIKELEKEVKALRKELKEKNVSLGKSDTLKTLKNGIELYEEALKDYHNTFNQYLVAWSNKLHIGLYIGYGSDEYYTEVIRPLDFKLQKFNHITNILSQIKEIEIRVKEIKTDLENGKEFIKVHV